MEHTKGKIEVWSHIGRGWAVQVMCCKDGKDALSGRDFEEAQANADEIVRRWNAFEEGGIVEELKDVIQDMLNGLEYLRNTKTEPYGFGIDRLEKTGQAALAKS